MSECLESCAGPHKKHVPGVPDICECARCNHGACRGAAYRRTPVTMSEEENDAALRQLADLVKANDEITSLRKQLADQDGRLIAHLREELDKTKAELAEMNASFELRWKADMRAIERWREESPVERDLLWPDHADLCVWLMKQLDEKTALIKDVLETLRRLPGKVGHRQLVERLRENIGAGPTTGWCPMCLEHRPFKMLLVPPSKMPTAVCEECETPIADVTYPDGGRRAAT